MTAPTEYIAPAHGRFTRIVVWLALVAMVQLLVQPLAAVAEDRSASDYTEWLLDRGVPEGHHALEQALGTAARAHHTSLESFVLDFVQILDAEGQLGTALDLFSVEGASVATADDLLALILADLRSLSPKESAATHRLNRADQAALAFGHGTTVSRSSRAATVARSELPPPGVHTPVVFGLKTSIQALGP